MSKRSNPVAIGFILAIALSACAGDLEDKGRFDAVLGGSGAAGGGGAGSGGGINDDVPACVTVIIASSCGAVGCHAAGMDQVDLVSDGMTDRLVDHASTTDLCKDQVFIATDGEPSLMLTKLEATPPCGSRMPLVGTLTDTQRTCLTDWVVSLGGAAPAGSM